MQMPEGTGATSSMRQPFPPQHFQDPAVIHRLARPRSPVQFLQNLTGYHIRDRDPHWEKLIHSSAFHLCPRGNGPSSYRLYEALQADTIPIYIWDEVTSSWILGFQGV
jgi:hypothetical protein